MMPIGIPSMTPFLKAAMLVMATWRGVTLGTPPVMTTMRRRILRRSRKEVSMAGRGGMSADPFYRKLDMAEHGLTEETSMIAGNPQPPPPASNPENQTEAEMAWDIERLKEIITIMHQRQYEECGRAHKEAKRLKERWKQLEQRISQIEQRLRAIDDFDADFCDTVQERLECLEHQISQSPHGWVQTSFARAVKDKEEPKIDDARYLQDISKGGKTMPEEPKP
jgi:hypothetical protein